MEKKPELITNERQKTLITDLEKQKKDEKLDSLLKGKDGESDEDDGDQRLKEEERSLIVEEILKATEGEDFVLEEDSP